MGKNWKGRGGGGGGGGGGDFTNCRGFACVIGTCDAAREKESNKELTNLLNQAIERVYPPTSSASVEPEPLAAKEESIADMLQNELKQFRQQKHSGAQDIVTINTGIKGIVFAKISRRDVCPVKLVKAIMDQIRDEKVPCSRHLVKMIPLQLAFYGGETEFMNSAKILAEACFTGEDTSVTLPTLQLSKVVHKRKSDQIEGAESEDQKPEDHDDQDSKRVCQEGDAQDVPEPQEPTAASFNMFSAPAATEAAALSAEVGTENSAPGAVQALPTPAASTVAAPLKPEIRYFILFKARNHNTLNKHMVIQRVRECLPAHLRQDYLHGQNAVIVEALKNIAGISYFPNYTEYNDLNLRKHQAQHCPAMATTTMIAHVSAPAAEGHEEGEGKGEVADSAVAEQEDGSGSDGEEES